MGYSIVYLSLVVLIPLAGLLIRVTEMSWADFVRVAFSDRALAAYRLTFGASFLAATINAVLGTLLAARRFGGVEHVAAEVAELDDAIAAAEAEQRRAAEAKRREWIDLLARGRLRPR